MSEHFRIERDTLGELKIPAGAYYGIQSFRASQNFQISRTQVHPEMIRSYLLLKKAAALAHLSLGDLDPLKAHGISDAVDDLLKHDFRKYFIVDAYQAGAGTSQNMNANEVIANRANQMLGYPLGCYKPIDPHDDVNRSQSTNDTYPTVLRLSCLTLSKKLYTELSLLAVSLDQKAGEFDGILKSARTHLQDAVPMRLGQEFSGYRDTLHALLSLLNQSQDLLRELGIGGSAAGTGLNVPINFRTQILEQLKGSFDDSGLYLTRNLFMSMQSQLPLMVYSNVLRAIALELTRICNDLRLLSSGPANGFGEIQLPETQAGSSIMPGKTNPSILEMANQVCFKVLGNDSALALAMQAGQLELNIMIPLMAQTSLESTEILTQAIRAIRTRCIDGLTANIDRCKKYFEQTSQIATALNPFLGYERVAKITQDALSSGQSVIEFVRQHKILTENELAHLIDTKSLTEPPEV